MNISKTIQNVAFALALSAASLLATARTAQSQSEGAQGTAAEAPTRTVRLPAATVVDAKIRSVVASVPINGSLVARETVAVTPQVTGYQITDVKVDVGDRVKTGQVLVTVDKAPLKAKLAQADASLAAAKATAQQAQSQINGQQASYDQAQSVLSRAQRLMKSGAGTQATLDDSRANVATAGAALQGGRDALASAKAQIEQAEATRNDAALQLDRTDIVSPVDGVVATRNADIGQMAMNTSTPLFTLIRDGTVEFDGTIIETAIPSIRVGQTATVNPAGFPPRTGTVRLISPNVDPTTRLGTIKISIADDTGLPIGIYAKAVVQTAKRDAVTVPLSAVIPGLDGSTVQVVQEDGTLKVVKVTTSIVDNGFIEIREGIGAGTTVVAKSGPFFRDGMKIRPVRQTAENGAPIARLPAQAPAVAIEPASVAATGPTSDGERAEAQR